MALQSRHDESRIGMSATISFDVTSVLHLVLSSCSVQLLKRSNNHGTGKRLVFGFERRISDTSSCNRCRRFGCFLSHPAKITLVDDALLNAFRCNLIWEKHREPHVNGSFKRLLEHILLCSGHLGCSRRYTELCYCSL